LNLKHACTSKALQFLNHIMGGSDKIRASWSRFNLIEWAFSSKS